jgi:hypothetical protein
MLPVVAKPDELPFESGASGSAYGVMADVRFPPVADVRRVCFLAPSQVRPYKFNNAGSPPWAEMLLLIAFSDA